MRVVHIIDDAGFGGVVRYIDTLKEALGDAVHHDRVVVDTGSVRLPRLDGDVVVLHATVAWRKVPFFLALRLATRGRMLVLVEHSYTEAYERLKVGNIARFRNLLRFCYGRADRVVAVSYGQAAWMRRAHLLPATRLVVIPSFTDVAGLRQIALPKDGARPLRLGAFGRYAEQKGFDVLIEAMRQVPAEVATLELRGLGPDADALKARAAQLDHVRVGDAVADVPAFLSSVDVVVVPSRWEAFGQVALEARAAGRPVIASAVDGLVEQIEADAGLLVEPDEAALLAQAIRSLSGYDGLEAMAQAARLSARDHAARSIAAWHDLLAGVSAHRSPVRLRLQSEASGDASTDRGDATRAA
ncbi:MAG TPA: glycosyltransferase family 4 protein [Hyphomicrobiaceae bacterium]|nr:glycosyltransferase family 4 protein [Hyphomicrobiaceae bacterium]